MTSTSEPDERTPHGVAPPDPEGHDARHDRLVEDAGYDSFPASDPPSWWAGPDPERSHPGVSAPGGRRREAR